MSSPKSRGKKVMASMIMPVSWEMWKERKARVFQNHLSTTTMIFAKIKDDTRI
jgi:hypothetical protein